MAGSALMRLPVRTLLVAGGGHCRTKTHSAFCWISRNKYFLKNVGGNSAFLVTLPALSFMGYQAYRLVSGSGVVHAFDKAQDVIEQADYLYSCGETEKLYQLLVQYKDSDNAEFLWRLARATRDLAFQSHISTEDKKRLTYEAFDCVKKALEINQSCFSAHKWYAVCLSDIGEYEGTKIKIGNAYVIREHLEKAITLNPKDATSIHILGLWCFAFAELPWYQHKIAAMIFASPPSSTYEEALSFFLRAEEVDCNFYSKNLLMVGKTYMMLKEEEKARMWLSKARDYPAHTEEDKQVHKEAVDLLKKLNN
ncbi:regulator of microtubule dynamics protein 1 [Lepisosteus oculatus]|uniref:Regulator of microtubule dynamics protein 1 n=1 Tax=Lepisosteus oculatus TaxID=7918 RepID=W5MWC1_LEPOC|nr:PREDICTED: regulator of microtubule dynamics protein 1 [Lepisosteus oculatus]